MSRHSIPIDASNLPDLLKFAEEVNITQTPRLIKQKGETLALLMPAGAAGKHTTRPPKRTIWTGYDPQLVRAALKPTFRTLFWRMLMASQFILLSRL